MPDMPSADQAQQPVKPGFWVASCENNGDSGYLSCLIETEKKIILYKLVLGRYDAIRFKSEAEAQECAVELARFSLIKIEFIPV